MNPDVDRIEKHINKIEYYLDPNDNAERCKFVDLLIKFEMLKTLQNIDDSLSNIAGEVNEIRRTL